MTAPITAAQLVQDRVHLSGVTLSPDGSRFAYVRTTFNKETGKNESQIWLANVDGTDRHQITQVGTGNANPVWSPDGIRDSAPERRGGGNRQATCDATTLARLVAGWDATCLSASG
jgi:Tol biopolymer transport system component